MKLSFTTLACPEWTWERILDEAKKLGYDGIEIRGIEGEMLAHRARPFLPENQAETKEQLRRNGLSICCLGTSVMLHNAAARETALQEGRQAVDLAQALETPFIRVFGDRIPDGEDRETALRRIVSGLEILADYCRGKQVEVLVETHGLFNRIESVDWIFERIQQPQVGLLWDIEHTFKVYGNEVEPFYKHFRPLIRHTHFKDMKRTADGFQLCLPGEGDIDLGRIVRILRGGGYEGWLSLEWEKKHHPELEEPEAALPAYAALMKILARDVP